jgi:hypothetical protein
MVVLVDHQAGEQQRRQSNSAGIRGLLNSSEHRYPLEAMAFLSIRLV